MKGLDVQIRSIFDLKESPMKIVEEAKRQKSGNYILNRNREVAVLLGGVSYRKLY